MSTTTDQPPGSVTGALADSLNLSPGTAVRWMHQAGADWNRYAADIARSRDHQP